MADRIIEQLGYLEQPYDVAEAALLLASLQQPELDLQRYRVILKKLAGGIAARHNALQDAGAVDDAGARLAALRDVIMHEECYGLAEGDGVSTIENFSLMRLIDTGRGSVFTLAVLYIACARVQGWDIEALSFPADICVLRLSVGGQRLLFDLADDVRVLDASDLRALLKNNLGAEAELSAVYLEDMRGRDLLIRLQNKVKLLQIESEDYAGALISVQAMQVLDDGEYRLLLDAGVLYARLQRKVEAADALGRYISLAPDGRDRQEAVLLLYDLQNM